MPFIRRFKDKYAGSSPENASVVRTLFDLLDAFSHLYKKMCPSVRPSPVIFRRVLGASCAVYPALFSKIQPGRFLNLFLVIGKQVEQSSDNRCVLWRTARVLVFE